MPDDNIELGDIVGLTATVVGIEVLKTFVHGFGQVNVASVTTGREYTLLLSDGTRMNVMGRNLDPTAERLIIEPEERTHHYGDECDPPHTMPLDAFLIGQQIHERLGENPATTMQRELRVEPGENP